jgi:hypothetical protein
MKTLLITIVLSLAFITTACSTAWVSTLDTILAVAAPALSNILQIVAIADGKPFNSQLAAKIATDATAIKTLAGDYASVSSAAGPGVCQQLNAAIATYQTDQSLVLQVAQVSDTNTQTKITLLAGLVAGTVQAITAVIPQCTPSPTVNANIRMAVSSPPLSVTNFVSEYNTILKLKTGNTAVDAVTPSLALHQHSKIARILTFGRLN